MAVLFGPLAAYMVTSKVEQRAARAPRPPPHRSDGKSGQLNPRFGVKPASVSSRTPKSASQGIVLRVETAEGTVAGFPPWLLEEKPPADIEQYQGVVRRGG